MALLRADPRRIGRPDGEPAADRAPDVLAGGAPEPLRSELTELLGAERVLARASDLIRYASDASPYRYLPKAVVIAHDVDDVAAVLAYGRRTGTPVTLRAGGTSLNGQAQGDGILVDVRRHWAGVTIVDEGRRARVRPGTVLGHANRVLAPHGRKLGPDPASTDAATVGGVIANNSGGMRCGVERDSYSTVRAITLVLASGTVIDTEAADAGPLFAEREPELAAGLAEIRDELRADDELSARVRRKFEIKNTMGYRLCAFLDADKPLEIFRRLLVGSEGTLAFIAEAVFETVAAAPAHHGLLASLRRHRRRHRAGAAARRGRGQRRRADGGAGADGRKRQHPRRPRALARAAAGLRRAAGRVRRRRGRTSCRPPRLGRSRCSVRASCCASPTSPPTPSGSRSPGGCARACSGWSAGCDPRARR